MENIKITVCTLTYNRFLDLENLIRSYLSLSYKNSELLVLDDLGSVETEDVVKKWQKTDNRIKYHKNDTNLGFINNLKQSYRLAKGDVIVFMGDDDIFIDNLALNYFAKAFAKPQVGVVKAAQILYKKGVINQAYHIQNKNEEITYFEKGADTLRSLWFESLSITGLAFRLCQQLYDSVNDFSTLYPQFEHMGQVCLEYQSASINKYIVGVQSHGGQLNCISYSLDGKETNLIDDWLAVYYRVESKARHSGKPFITNYEFRSRLAKFIPLFFPYTRITSGFAKTARVIMRTIMIYPIILFYPTFIISSFVSTVLPSDANALLTEIVKKKRLQNDLAEEQVSSYNAELSKYYSN